MAKKAAPQQIESSEFAIKPESLGGPIQTAVDNSGVTVDNLIGRKVTQLEFGVGSHLMGQHLTLSAQRGSSLEIAEKGILAISKSGRVCLLPWSNIKAVEIIPAKFNLRTGRLK